MKNGPTTCARETARGRGSALPRVEPRPAGGTRASPARAAAEEPVAAPPPGRDTCPPRPRRPSSWSGDDRLRRGAGSSRPLGIRCVTSLPPTTMTATSGRYAAGNPSICDGEHGSTPSRRRQPVRQPHRPARALRERVWPARHRACAWRDGPRRGRRRSSRRGPRGRPARRTSSCRPCPHSARRARAGSPIRLRAIAACRRSTARAPTPSGATEHGGATEDGAGADQEPAVRGHLPRLNQRSRVAPATPT